MSPDSPVEVDARRYGGVNGNDITLTEKRTGANNKVIEFKLRNNDSLLGIQLNLLLFCLTLFLGNLNNSLTLVTLSVVALALHCRHITASVDFDTLLVVESVGIQISSKKIFAGFNSSQFLPWTTVEDVFINEVITGRIETVKGMPGIYVRGAGKSDKTRALQTQHTLKVPGSYWLAHKQSIYKFTFKYDESTRDTKEFLYKDELMKAIRRIIKCQPSQGQLTTVHLSITCKHTFWTRQDKMFAKMKFCNRVGATVFPQAFSLTVSVVDNPESEMTDKICGDIIAVQPLTISPSLTNMVSLSNEVHSQRPVEDENCKRKFGLSNSRDETIVSQESNKSTDHDGLLNITEPLGSTTPRWRRNSRRRKRQDSWISSREVIVMDRCTNDLAVGDVSTTIIVGNGPKAPSDGLTGALPYSDSKNQTTMNEDKGRRKGENNEKRIDFEPVASRSSDITDQVMEGLMFTIKQDEDNVKVVEQRTKTELDEVLENSEKVETKEGERSLVNSSLLRLENLVTKIETQDKRLKDPKTNEATPVIDSLDLLSPYSVLEPSIREQPNSPLLLRNSFTSNCEHHVRDRVFSKLFPSTYALLPIELANLKMENRGEDDKGKFHQNLTRQQKRRLDSEEKYRSDWRRPATIGKRKKEENFNRSDDNDPTNNHDDDNNNNNNHSKNIMDGEVPIDMWKLLQDITRGAKVMVERISDIDIINATRPSTISVPAAPNKTRRTLVRGKK